MTEENIKLRDTLKSAESVIVAALRSQPENDEECKAHLEKAVVDIRSIVSTNIVDDNLKAISPSLEDSIFFLKKNNILGSIDIEPVFENDAVSINGPEYKIESPDDRGDFRGFIGTATCTNGHRYLATVTINEINRYRKRPLGSDAAGIIVGKIHCTRRLITMILKNECVPSELPEAEEETLCEQPQSKLGNAAKLRDAVIEARRFVFAAMKVQRDILVNDKINEPYVIKAKDTLAKIDAALAACTERGKEVSLEAATAENSSAVVNEYN